MDGDDIEQDLFLDLWHRRVNYQPDRAGFATFADRIVAHRVASLATLNAGRQAERQIVSLDGAGGDEDGGTLPDHEALSEGDLALAIDVHRFVAGLSPALQCCCALLLAPNRQEAALESGLHRSTMYENARRLRSLAERAGLKIYVVAPRQIDDCAGKCRS